jgi:hypothetical protein
MDSLVFHVEADKLDTNVLDSIKAFFGNRKIEISVKPERNPAMAGKDVLEKVKSSEAADYEYKLSADDLKEYIHQAIAGEPDEAEKFKRILLPTVNQPA